MFLGRQHPEVAWRPCDSCRRWLYRDDGTVERGRGEDGEPGEPVPRPASLPVACETHTGCPKGHWSRPKGWGPREAAAARYYRQCRATNRFPADAWFRAYAGVLFEAEAAADRLEARQNAVLAWTRGASPKAEP